MSGRAASCAPLSRIESGDRGDDVRDTRDIVVSLVGYLLVVAMGIAVVVAVMSH